MKKFKKKFHKSHKNHIIKLCKIYDNQKIMTNKELLIYQGKNWEIILKEDSKNETIWATKTLKEHIMGGFTINKNRLQQNYEKFLQAVEDVKKILPKNSEKIKNKDILELVKSFVNTWFKFYYSFIISRIKS